ncbi:Flavin-dependent L-tryptophan oxidase RebO precursor [compost metagenome]
MLDISYNHYLSQNYPVDLEYVYRIEDGLSNLPLAFYKSLKAEAPIEYTNQELDSLGTVKWKLGCWVSGIYKSEASDKVFIKYNNKNSTEKSYENFNYIVCAIPFSTLRTVEIAPVFSNIKMQGIKEINYVDTQKTLFLCKKRFWEEDTEYGRINGGNSLTDMSITNIIYPSDHPYGRNPSDPGVLIASYNQGREAVYLGNTPIAVHDEIVKRQVEMVHGLPNKYLDSIVQDSKYITWNNEEWFRAAVCKYMPEQKRTFGDSLLKPEYNSRVFFAGEHVSSTPSWIQGSLYTGKLAANDLAKVARNRS